MLSFVAMPTTPEQELAEQRARWRLLPHMRHLQWHDRLLKDEFLDPAEIRGHQEKALGLLLDFAASNVPFYGTVLGEVRRRLPNARPLEVLANLPPLTRNQAQENAASLRPLRMPPGQRRVDVTRTSGTTGQPIEIDQSAASLSRFAWLKQREFRWFRMDPSAKLAAIRPMTELPRTSRGTHMEPGEVLRGEWLYVGKYFHTGPFVGFSNLNAVEEQVGFLRAENPAYLLMQSAGLEHVAFAGGGRIALRGSVAISQTLTPAMRATIETAFGAPVHQNYGLNEIGLVASRCPEGGRYHVHAEHCVVEIVDDEGQPCRPGDRGRLLVTALANAAMPLLRYDADDLAVAVEGPCPCGRTLPSFGEVIGRYRRIAALPRGTWRRWGAIQLALHTMPPNLAATLRRYQVRQFRDEHWALKIDATGDHAEAIGAWVRPRFAEAVEGDEAPPLTVVATDRFEGDLLGKFQSFLSDFMPAPDTADTPQGAPP
ncbi:MAG: phenylacetate--CoA ligase family protein [Deltaproteobacteria bacterium]|nr:phenylacetate--CoA ligase family protein [Deltaproteobacteria bacterium]